MMISNRQVQYGGLEFHVGRVRASSPIDTSQRWMHFGPTGTKAIVLNGAPFQVDVVLDKTHRDMDGSHFVLDGFGICRCASEGGEGGGARL